MGRSSKYKSKMLEKIEVKQIRLLMDLKNKLEGLIYICQESIKKIESEGIKGYYSGNHDCTKYAEMAHKLSNELSILNFWKIEIEKDFKN